MQVKKYSIYQAILVLFFAMALFVFSASGQEKGIVISEIMYDPSGSDTDREWIEIFNEGGVDVDLSGWKFFEASTNHTMTLEQGSFIVLKNESVVIVQDAEKFLDEHKDFAGTILDSSFSLSNDGEGLALKDKSGLIVDSVSYSKTSGGAGNGFSIELFDGVWRQSIDLGGSPGKKNEKIKDQDDEEIVVEEPIDETDPPPIVDEKKEYSKGILITELFPNPFKSQYEEYVELFNSTKEDVDLKNWTLRDGSKTGKYVFAESFILKAQKYLAIFKNDFKFALNNSGFERVTLFDPNGVEVSKVEYTGTKRNLSYSFDGARWRWSKFLTPGDANVLNNEPFGTVKLPEDIFAKAYADFSVSTGDVDGDKVKVTWDFGDGHKSYLAKTRHKYEKVGTYAGSVKFSDGSEDVVKTFVAEVKNFPHPKVRIVSVNANPVGSDTLGESLTIENKSKEKIDLFGWSIATGDKTLSNHPITEKFVLKKKAVREITREISKFVLNNKKGKIELRYPDGEVADKIKYEKKAGIQEDEKYIKTKSGWSWVGGKKIESHQSSVISNQDVENLSSVISNQPASLADGSSNAEISIVESVIAPSEIKRENKLLVTSNNLVKIELLKSTPRTIGNHGVREIDGIYFFTPESQQKPHYAISFFNSILSSMNLSLNMLTNFFFR